MLKICIIACYFGKLPIYFNLWKQSCETNDTIDFLFITDQDVESTSNNFIVKKMQIFQLQDLIRKTLYMQAAKLKYPYKICDFRPAFGLIFEKELKNYDFWGHCDLDVIFGDLRQFFTEEVLIKYQKILKNGNLSLYKNQENMNRLFMKNGAIYSFNKVFSSDENYAFDEFTGINKIIRLNNIPIYEEEIYADIDPKYKSFKMCNLKNYYNQIFVYEYGKVFIYYLENDILKKKEISHIHFQKKNIELNEKNGQHNKYIIDNVIKKIDIEITKETLKKYENIKENYKIERICYIYQKLKQFFKCNYKQKKIWLKQKIWR